MKEVYLTAMVSLQDSDQPANSIDEADFFNVGIRETLEGGAIETSHDCDFDEYDEAYTHAASLARGNQYELIKVGCDDEH